MSTARLERPALTVRAIDRRLLPEVAAIHCLAFPTSAMSRLGTETVRRYYEWQLTGPHDSVALGGFADGVLAGFCIAGVFRNKMSGYLRKNRWFLIGRFLRAPWLIAEAGFRDRLVAAFRIAGLLPKTASAVSLYRDSDPRSFGILAVGVHPQFQGYGLGQLLMREAEAVARQRGFEFMNLSVKVSNHQAIRFYESLNWQRRASANSAWEGEMTKCLNE